MTLPIILLTASIVMLTRPAEAELTLNDPESSEGFVALLLMNEVPFPGDKRYVSVANSKQGMLQILWVLHNRLHHAPAGYTQRSIAMVSSDDIIDVMAAGGVRGQVDGFYRETDGTPTAIDRVHARTARLVRIANSGPPGKFHDLVSYAKHLGEAYFSEGPDGANLFRDLKKVDGVTVTGSAFSWMTDEPYYAPGGSYVRITDAYGGSQGGNRFFTLRKRR